MITRFGLLLLGAVAGACAADDGGGSGSSGDGSSSGGNASATLSASSSASTSSTMSASESSTTNDPTDTSSSTDDTTSSTTDASTTSTSMSETASSSSGSEVSGESTGNGAEVCMAGCQVEVDCGFCATKWKSVEACFDWCTANLVKAGEYSLSCRAAWHDVSECVGNLDCEEFTAWCAKDPPFRYPCVTADQVLSFDCAGQ